VTILLTKVTHWQTQWKYHKFTYQK